MSPILKILVLFKESLRDLKCLHSLFEYCRRYRILASKNLTTASEDGKENTGAPIVTNSPRHPGKKKQGICLNRFLYVLRNILFSDLQRSWLRFRWPIYSIFPCMRRLSSNKKDKLTETETAREKS